MKKNNICLLLFLLSGAVSIGFLFPNVDDFAGRFYGGVKISAAEGVINVNMGCLAPVVTDWNNDGKKDLIVGQFENAKIRLYLNYGTDSQPVFKEYSFLQAGQKDISLSYG